MLSKLRARLTYANVVATLALFLVVSGGTAWAVNEWTGANIVDESLTGADIQNQTVGTSDLAIGSVFGTRIRDDAILSQHVVNNSLKGHDIDEQTFTAPLVRAFVRVNTNSCTGSGICPIDQSKGVTSVKRVEPGSYCVTAPAVSSANVSAAATVDHFATSEPANTTAALTRPFGSCAEMRAISSLVTERQPVITANRSRDEQRLCYRQLGPS